MRIFGCTSRLIEYSVKSLKEMYLNNKDFIEILTCGILCYHPDRSKEGLFHQVDRRCCMHQEKNQSPNQSDVPTCIQQFYLPINKTNKYPTDVFAIIPGDCLMDHQVDSHQSTRRRYARLLHILRKLLYHRHIQNPNFC